MGEEGRSHGSFWAVWWGTIVSPSVTLQKLNERGLTGRSFLAYGLEIRPGLVAFYGSAAGIWTLVLSAAGLKVAHGLSAPKSLVTVCVSLALSYAPGGLLLIR